MIELVDVHKSFGEQHVLRGMSFSLEQGQTLVVLGRSGTGKSVTLKHIVGLLHPDSGKILVNGIDVASADATGLREIRRQVAYLFQTGALVNWLSVRDNVSLPLVERRDMPADEIRERVDESLGSLDMLQHADKMPANISGGMRKRAALARVLVQEPDAILYDEPTAGLDPIMGRTVGRLIQEVQSSGERAAIVVTHDMDLAFQVATEIALHYEGRLVERAPPDVFEKSTHPVIREFLQTRDRPGKASP